MTTMCPDEESAIPASSRPSPAVCGTGADREQWGASTTWPSPRVTVTPTISPDASMTTLAPHLRTRQDLMPRRREHLPDHGGGIGVLPGSTRSRLDTNVTRAPGPR